MKTTLWKILTFLSIIPLVIFIGCEEEIDEELKITTVSITPESATVQVGEQQQFSALLTDQNGNSIEGDITWSSSDTTIATLDTSGLASAIAQGVTTITATAGENKTGTATLNVGVSSLVLNPSSAEILVGDTLTVEAVFTSSTGEVDSAPNVTWSTSDAAIATVETSGLLTAVSAGTATITGTHNESGTTGTMNVTVSVLEGAFNISKIAVEATGNSATSQPELVRFISETEGVIVNSKQNTLDFISISTTSISISGEQISLTDDPDSEASSLDVSVDETIIATVVTKGACERGELYLIDAASRTKYGPYELGYNPDAIDIAVDNQYVVVVNEMDYEDAADDCGDLFTGYPGVSIYDISAGLGSATLVKDMVITGSGSTNNQLREPEGVKIAPDGETVYMTLQESNELGWFSLSSIPDTLQNIVEYTNPEHEPDGLWLNSDGTILCTAGEIDGYIGVHSVGADGGLSTQRFFELHPAIDGQGWEIGNSGENKMIEPEEVVIAEYGGKTFALATLQDPGAVVVLNITDLDNIQYDSGVICELNDYTVTGDNDNCGVYGPGCGAPEGLAYRNGYVLVANTYDPSVALLSASWVQ